MAQICGKARYRAISAHMWGSIELLSLGVQGGVVYAAASGSADFDGCLFTQCNAHKVRLHSHTAPQAPTPQREATQIPLLMDHDASTHAVASIGALIPVKDRHRESSVACSRVG